jgi:hypothetical protein
MYIQLKDARRSQVRDAETPFRGKIQKCFNLNSKFNIMYLPDSFVSELGLFAVGFARALMYSLSVASGVDVTAAVGVGGYGVVGIEVDVTAATSVVEYGVVGSTAAVEDNSIAVEADATAVVDADSD